MIIIKRRNAILQLSNTNPIVPPIIWNKNCIISKLLLSNSNATLLISLLIVLKSSAEVLFWEYTYGAFIILFNALWYISDTNWLFISTHILIWANPFPYSMAAHIIKMIHHQITIPQFFLTKPLSVKVLTICGLTKVIIDETKTPRTKNIARIFDNCIFPIIFLSNSKSVFRFLHNFFIYYCSPFESILLFFHNFIAKSILLFIFP